MSGVKRRWAHERPVTLIRLLTPPNRRRDLAEVFGRHSVTGRWQHHFDNSPMFSSHHRNYDYAGVHRSEL